MYRTDAHALHAILSAVQESKTGTLHVRWAEVLGAEVNTPEFDRRHAEVVTLYSGTLRDIAALPEAQRQNYGPFRHAWWEAVITPNHQWGNGQRVNIINKEHLALLHTAGDVIEAKLGSTPLAPGAGSLDALQEQISEWVTMLTDEPDTLPNEGLRQTIIQQLQHVAWLIENVELFGAASVAGATQAAVGGIALAAPHVAQKSGAKWKKMALALLGALAFFNTGVDTTTAAIGHAGDIATYAITSAEHVKDALTGD